MTTPMGHSKTQLVMDKYYERRFNGKEQSIKIPDKPKLEEYIERLETIVKHWGVKKSLFKCR